MQLFKRAKDPNGHTSFHQLNAKAADGTDVDFSKFDGKVVLVVNGASDSRYNTQYAGLQQLYEKYHQQGFEILLFPCNQFGNGEPNRAKQASEFAITNYKITFPIMEKADVNGLLVHPVYEFLKSQQTQLGLTRIKWNFEKFLVDKNGQCVDRFSWLTDPADIDLYIANLLANP